MTDEQKPAETPVQVEYPEPYGVDYVGTPPGRLPEELGGDLALVGNREAEGDELPEGAVPFDPKPNIIPSDKPNLDYTSAPAVTPAPTSKAADDDTETADQAAVEDKPAKRTSRSRTK